MLAGMRLALEIAEQEPLRKVMRRPFNVPDGDSDDALMEFVQRASQTVYHPTSTCAIGAVVDPQLRVYGIDGLRVADASVMPTIIRGHTHAPSVLIGRASCRERV